MVKKLLLLLLALLVPAVSATTVILVSDNQADCLVANNTASVLVDAKIVVTTWGVYDENLVDEILALNPDKVIIVGGPVAVPENYTAALEEAGIEVERIGGETRYETNRQVIEKFKEKLKEKKRKVVVVHGNVDGLANISEDAVVVLTNGTNLTVDLEELEPEEVEVVETPGANLTGIARVLETHGFKVRLQSIPEHAMERILENKVRQLKVKINVLKKLGVDTEDLESDLQELEEMINEKNYTEAYKLALMIENKAMVKTKLRVQAKTEVKAKVRGKGKGVGAGVEVEVEVEANESAEEQTNESEEITSNTTEETESNETTTEEQTNETAESSSSENETASSNATAEAEVNASVEANNSSAEVEMNASAETNASAEA
ncbi:cell wall-binding protein [Methanocaldococcus fervens]|uniref:Cell wall-binding domain protein-like protein n=1 Tax=Methanocaldococcus fervens (strain DSM 4213 / JCM 15782 / AG86) TaxID=573064 RepID=C7P790_METFA|nr:cell wall-binding protein [Methanocaldococcus fervens]ACV24422.1 Putative cell wall-binding domain protein-like protein [Methanocaldococcus fervens AG86]